MSNYHSQMPREFAEEQAAFVGRYRRGFAGLYARVLAQYGLLLLGCSLCAALLFRAFRQIHLKMARVMQIFQRVDPGDARRFVQGCADFSSKWVDEGERIARMRLRSAANFELRSQHSRQSSEARLCADEEPSPLPRRCNGNLLSLRLRLLTRPMPTCSARRSATGCGLPTRSCSSRWRRISPPMATR